MEMFNWTLNGTKILGYVIAISSAFATGSVVFPPPLNKYSAVIVAWSAFVNMILGIVVVGRGHTNTETLKAQAAAPAPPSPVANIPKSMFWWILAPLFVGIVLMFYGCTTTGQASPSATDTFNKLILAAGTVDDTVINTLDTLVKAGTISSANATAALAITDKIQAAVNVANTAFNSGDQATATAKLTAAASAITQVQVCLAQPPASLATCLQGVKSP